MTNIFNEANEENLYEVYSEQKLECENALNEEGSEIEYGSFEEWKQYHNHVAEIMSANNLIVTA